MVYAPLVMPEVITGLSLLLLFVAIGLDRGFWTVTLAHTTLTMCFVTVVVQARLMTFDRSLEEAAMDLGAPPLRDLLHRDAAADRAVRRRGLSPGLHPVARRSGDRELHLRSRRDHAADQDLQPGAPGLSPEINAASAILIGIVTLGVIAATLFSKRAASSPQRRLTERWLRALAVRRERAPFRRGAWPRPSAG